MSKILLVLALLAGGMTACERQPDPDLARLPEPAQVSSWFGENTEAQLDGRVLELRGRIPERFLERGGSIWRRGPVYFYLFNVKVRDLLVEYPGLQAVRAVAVAGDGTELARATVRRDQLNQYEWEDALRLASLAQREGTRSPRRIENLIEWGEEHTDYRYRE